MSYSRHLSRKTNEIREIGKYRKPEKNTYRKKPKQAKQKKKGSVLITSAEAAKPIKQNKNRIIIKTAREKEKWGGTSDK